MTPNRYRIRRALVTLFILTLIGGAGILVGTFVIAPPAPPSAPATRLATAAAEPLPAAAVTSQAEDAFSREWGIQAATVRLAAGGNVVDFRYKILDVDRAAKLSEPEYEAHLLLHSEEKVNAVNPKKSGPLLEGKQKLRGGEYRSLFFANPSLRVKTGDLVTVVIGKYRAENLQVQ